ncbi:hypothetical protein ACROYT_G003193 [Oculina patagonica]
MAWTPTYSSSWSTSPTSSPYLTEVPTIPDYAKPLVPPTRKPDTLLPKISLAIQVVLFVICLMENSIAIFILFKSIRKGRKTFARYTLISLACADILIALLYYPAQFVKFSHGEYVWLVQGQAGDVLCKIYAFLAQIPGKVIALCLVALACDVTRNLSTKGRREHTRRFSAILMVFFWIIAAGLSAMYFVISKVEYKKCIIDPAQQMTMVMLDLIHSFMFLVPADLILMILNLVILCRVRRRKKEITRRKREVRKAGKIKVRRQKKRIRDVRNDKVVQFTDEVHEMLSNKSCGPGGENFAAERSNPETLTEMSTETNKDSDASEVDVDEEDASSSTASATVEESLEMTQEEARMESATSFLFVILSIILLIVPYICEGPQGPRCSEYVFFATQVAANIYAAMKPGIYAITDKEFRERYKQLSPFACCCFRRIRCHIVPQQVGTTSSLSGQEGGV